MYPQTHARRRETSSPAIHRGTSTWKSPPAASARLCSEIVLRILRRRDFLPERPSIIRVERNRLPNPFKRLDLQVRHEHRNRAGIILHRLRIHIQRKRPVQQRIMRIAAARLDRRPARHRDEILVFRKIDQRHDSHVAAQSFAHGRNAQRDRIECPTPIMLITNPPAVVGIGLRLGDLGQLHFRDRRHETERAVD